MFELQVVAQDLDAFSRFALNSLMHLPNVKDLHTSFSLGEVKASRALPLGHLARRTAPRPVRAGQSAACHPSRPKKSPRRPEARRSRRASAPSNR